MFAKLINNQLEPAPINYETGSYKDRDKEIIFNFNKNEELMRLYGYKPVIENTKEEGHQYSITYEETENSIIEHIEDVTEQRRREYLDNLSLTPSDVERALYYSDLHIDFDDLKALIAQQLPQVDIKGLAIEFRANNFYRGAVDKNGNRIIDTVGAILGYTSEDMDYLFENKELPIKEES